MNPIPPTTVGERPSPTIPAWGWANVFSLDAVLVGLLWQWVFTIGFCDRRPVGYEWAVVGLSIWLVYTLDRLLDSTHLDLSRNHTLRHRVHLRFRRSIALIWFLALAANVSLITVFATESQLRWGCSAVAIAMAYLASAQLFRRSVIWFPKELQVGLVFAFGTSLTAWSEIDGARAGALWIATLMVGILFAANCLAIAWWERELDADQHFVSLASGSKPVSQWLPWLLTAHLVLAFFLWGGELLSSWIVLHLVAGDLLLLCLIRANGWIFNRATTTVTGCCEFATPSIDRRVALADFALSASPLVGCLMGAFPG